MIARRVTITTAVAFLVASIAFSQMRYSRRSPSPQPQASPTPTPTPASHGSSQLQKPLQKIAPAPTPPKPVYRQSQTSSQTTPLPVIPARQEASQSGRQKIGPTATPSKRGFGQPQTGMQRPTPIPTPPNQGYLQPQRGNQKTAARLPSPPQTFRQGQVPSQAMTPAPIPVKPTPTPVPPPDVKAYLDRQVAQSKDKKFHMTVNGKDLPLTPFHVWAQRSTGFNTSSTHIDMRGDEGRIYDIEFTTTGAQITNIRIHRINGETVR